MTETSGEPGEPVWISAVTQCGKGFLQPRHRQRQEGTGIDQTPASVEALPNRIGPKNRNSFQSYPKFI